MCRFPLNLLKFLSNPLAFVICLGVLKVQERVGEVKVKAALDCTLTDIFVQIIISVTVHNEVFGAERRCKNSGNNAASFMLNNSTSNFHLI